VNPGLVGLFGLAVAASASWNAVRVTDGPATLYARAANAWTPIDWWKLEARALYDVRPLRQALAPFAPPAAWRDLAKGAATGWGCLLTLSHIAALTLPLLAGLGMVGWLMQRDDPAPVGMLGLVAFIGAVLAGIGLIIDRRSPTGIDPKVGRMLGALHLVPSAVALPIAAGAVIAADAEGPWGVLGFALDLGVGIAYFALHRGPADNASGRWKRNLDRLHAALDAIDPAERARLEADVRTALDTLEERGLVGAEELERARSQPLGFLGMAMAPRKDMAPKR